MARDAWSDEETPVGGETPMAEAEEAHPDNVPQATDANPTPEETHVRMRIVSGAHGFVVPDLGIELVPNEFRDVPGDKAEFVRLSAAEAGIRLVEEGDES